jgi:hypothetical protein
MLIPVALRAAMRDLLVYITVWHCVLPLTSFTVIIVVFVTLHAHIKNAFAAAIYARK